MIIRNVELTDSAALCRIYNYYILHTAVTFETVPLQETEMETRIAEVWDSGLPYLVAESANGIAGYCYLHEWNRKTAYATTREVTIYLDKEYTGKGIGTLLFQKLLSTIDKNKTHVLLSGITLPNPGSVRLHEKFGFRQVSHLSQVGWKLNNWQDVGHWQLLLSEE